VIAADGLAQTAPAAGITGIALRVGLSVTALAIVLWKVPLGDVARAVTTLDPFWIGLALATVYAAIVLSAIKWQVLLGARGYSLSVMRLTRHYLVGLFFNNFLPTSVGGDVVRAWDVGRDIDDAPEGAASVIAERLIASIGLGLTAALGLPFTGVGPRAWIAVAVVIAASSTLVALFLAPSRSEKMIRSAMSGRFEGVADWAARAVRAVNETLRKRSAIVLVLALSIGFQVLVALVNYCIFRSLGANVGLGETVLFTSIVSAVTMVPISISGHGVREASYAYFFGLAHVASATAVSASVLFFALVALATLPGALLFAIGRTR
jgi:uncharacterized protein (TIRG00374 family)